MRCREVRNRTGRASGGRAVQLGRKVMKTPLDDVAGNGLVNRRLFLTASVAAGAAASGIALPAPASADALVIESWMKVPGSPFVGTGSPHGTRAKSCVSQPTLPTRRGREQRAPLHRLNGTITPTACISSAAIAVYRTLIGRPSSSDPWSGLRPLVFTLRCFPAIRWDLDRIHRMWGNGLQLYQKDPAPLDCQALHGLVSCAEWTGVKLSTRSMRRASNSPRNGFWQKAPTL